MSLKIGIVTEYYYPLLGGISEHVHNTMLRLRAMGHDVKIITSGCGRSQYAICDRHIPNGTVVYRLGHSIPIFSNGSFARFSLGTLIRDKLTKIYAEEQFDLLHVHSPLTPTLPLMAIREAKCPVVGTFHTYFDRSLLYGLFREILQKHYISKLRGQIVVSRSCIDALSRFFILNPRIIPNGVDTSEFNPNVKPFKEFDDKKFNLLFLGRLDPRNGLLLMLRTFEIIKSEIPEVRLIIVGDGPLRSYYGNFLSKAVHEDIHFVGPALQHRNRYYASCDVFCSPVDKASFGVTLLEAMASGKPIVATENAGYKEVLGTEEGFLVRGSEPGLFARHIIKLLKDEKLRKEMGSRGRDRALRYSWDVVTGKIEQYYNEVLSQ